MKPHFKKDVFGEKICWLVKTKPTKDAYLTNFNYTTSELLPKTHVLKSVTSSSYFIYVLILIPIFYFSYKIITCYNQEDFRIINTSIYLLLSIVTMSITIYTKSQTKEQPSNLILTHEGIIFKTLDIKWQDVKGIYVVYRKAKTSHVINSIVIKTKDKNHYLISETFTKLGLSKLPDLLSAYKWRWDKQDNAA
jgi:hypothetical protein